MRHGHSPSTAEAKVKTDAERPLSEQGEKDIAKIGGVWSVYIFSLGDDTFDEEFADMSKVTVAPIPEAIMRVYRRIFQTT